MINWLTLNINPPTEENNEMIVKNSKGVVKLISVANDYSSDIEHAIYWLNEDGFIYWSDVK